MFKVKPIHEVIQYNPSNAFIRSQWTGEKLAEPAVNTENVRKVPVGRFGKLSSGMSKK